MSSTRKSIFKTPVMLAASGQSVCEIVILKGEKIRYAPYLKKV